MVNYRRVDQPKESDSPRGEVGEIDTRAPFQSVKAAVCLFGEVAVSRDRRNNSLKKKSSENVLDKETQLLLAQRELNKIKQKLDSSDNAKSKALVELEKAMLTLKDLQTKLTAVKESKQAAIEAAEVVKNQAKQLEEAKSQNAIGFEAWKRELEHARKTYSTTVTELDAAKKELTKIRQDFDAALEAKSAAFQAAGEAQRSANLNKEKFSELSKEIVAVKLSIEEVKLATATARDDQQKVMAEKEQKLSDYKAAKEEAQMNLMSLKKEYDSEHIRDLETKFAKTSAEVEVLQEKMKKAHASEMDAVRRITSELNEATITLQDVAEEEGTLRELVASLRDEVERVKKEKEQVEEAVVQDEQTLKLHQLTSETEQARREAEEMSRKAQELKNDAEAAGIAAEEAEKKLKPLQKEAEIAKAAEERAIGEMKILSEMQGKTQVSNSESHGKIRLSVEEFEALSGKVKVCQDMIEKAEAVSMAQLEVINKRREEAERKVEANLKAIEEIKTATEIALKNAQMAESAKVVVEGELKRWRQEEPKVAADASS